MTITTLVTPELSINTYLIIDDPTGKAAIIDPPRQIEAIVQQIQQQNVQLIAIIETHVHADFISGAKELKAHFQNRPLIYCSVMGGDRWLPAYADSAVKDRESIILGNLRLQAWHTPGHTPEHLSWLLFDDAIDKSRPIAAFTGDFLFVGCVGRPDLLGDEMLTQLATELYNSVFQLLPKWPNELVIFPAHGSGSLCGKSISSSSPSSTLSVERQTNPYLTPQPQELWIANLVKEMPLAPPYFSKVKQLNVAGVKLLSELNKPSRINLEALSKLQKDGIEIVDVRSVGEFANAHLLGSVNVPINPTFSKWISYLVSPDTPIAIVGANEKELEEVKKVLHLIGYDQIEAEAILDTSKIDLGASNLATIETLSVKEAFARIQQNSDDIVIVDVRTPGEWNSGHAPNAMHIELIEFPRRIAEIPQEKTIALMCGSGVRSAIASSLLKRAGHRSLFNIQGGMQAWKSSGYTISCEK